MATIVKRVVGVLLALAGLALTVVGAWFATQLGTSGTATFTVRPSTTDPVLIGPDVLNRVDADVVVTATPTAGGSVWMALANPSDAAAVVGGSAHLEVTGVSVRDWALLTSTTGSGSAPELGEADLWRQQDDAPGRVSLTVEQSEAPETLVVATTGGQLSSLTLRLVDKSWFVKAVIGALIGLFLLVAGIALVTSRRTRHGGRPGVPPVASGDSPRDADGEAGTLDPLDRVGAGDGTGSTVPDAPDVPVSRASPDEAPDQTDRHDPEEVTR